MRLKTIIYKGLAISNDINSVQQASKHRSPKPIVRRVARRAYGRLTGRLARRLLG